MHAVRTILKDPNVRTIATLVSIVTVVLILIGAAAYIVFTTEPVFSTSESYIDDVGPIRAQEQAVKAITNANTHITGHMYEHEVGSYLFHKYGPSGVAYCRTYFDHGCYNGFMLEIHSLETINETLKVCSSLNSDAYGGCIHGAGHVALILNQYDVSKALKQCASFVNSNPTASGTQLTILTGCSFGVFMENAIPGFMGAMAAEALAGDFEMKSMKSMQMASDSPEMSGHAKWAARKDDPYFPCSNSTIATPYLAGCWEMQMVMLSNNTPTAQNIAKCSSLTNRIQKSYCFVGIADALNTKKEMTADEVFAVCSGASDIDSKNICLVDFAQRDYLNNFNLSVPDQICARIDDSGKPRCLKMQALMQKLILKD